MPSRNQSDSPMLDESPKVGIGKLIGHVMSTSTSPTFFNVEIWISPDSDLRPGQVVAVHKEFEQLNDIIVLLRINNVHEVNPHEDGPGLTLQNAIPFDTKYAPEGSSTVIYRFAESEPLEEIILDKKGKIIKTQKPMTLARSRDPVHEVDDKMIVTAALGLSPSPSEGIHVGHLQDGESIQIVLKKDTIQRHIFICGGIGSGKSYTRGVLAEELHCLGIPQINIDINGELIEATKQLGGENYKPGEDNFKVPLSALSSADVLDAIPSINPNSNIATLVAHSHEKLLEEVYRGQRSHFNVNDLTDMIRTTAPELNMEAANTLRPALLRTGSLNRMNFIGEPFPWGKKIVPGKIINIDCRAMLLPRVRLVAASIMRDIQNLAKNKKIPFVVLSIDEFHLVAPKDEGTITTQVLREIARIGRHYRIGLILTTQSPADVDRAILKRLLTRFLHAIEPDQLDALRGVFSDASDQLIKMMPKMPQGECVLTGAYETIKHATAIRIRKRETTHEGATPDIFADLAERGWKSKKSLQETIKQ